MTIAAVIPNLMDRSRFGDRVAFVATGREASESGASLVLVDLDRCGDLAQFRIPDAHVIGFGPHVDTELHQAALAAGYDEVLARSAFFKRLDSLLTTTDR